MYKILKNTIEMDDYSVQKLSNQPPEPFEWNIVEGTELNVNDCIGGKGKIEVKGNTEQKQLSGKNLFDRDNVIEKNGTINDNNIFRGGGGNYCIVIPCKSNTTYTAQKRNDGDTNRFALASCETNPSDTADVTTPLLNNVRNDSAGNLSITTGSTANYIIMQYFRNVESTLTKQQILDSIQIEEGSTATDYEPYCGGQASPNPEYPQEIKVVTGDNVLKHIGKNLLKYPYNETTVTKSGITFTDKGDGTVLVNGSNSSGASVYYNMQVKSTGSSGIILNPGTYTFDLGIASNVRATISEYDNTNNVIAIIPTNQRSKTFIVTEKIKVNVILAVNTNLSVNNVLIKPQIIEGSTATPYEEYRVEEYELNLGDMELCKIGDYSDILFKNVVGDENYNAELEEGAWYKKQLIGKFNDAQQLTSASVNENYFEMYTPTLNVEAGLNSSVLRNIAISNVVQSYPTNYSGLNGSTSTAKIRVRLSIDYATSHTEMKDYLIAKNFCIYYVQNSPTYEKITDPTLISQLEALRKAKWFKGVNHWWTETNNLEPVLKGTYRQAINE